MNWSPPSVGQNAESLATLLRTLRLGQGTFALVLLHCNYTSLQVQIWQALQAEPDLPPLRALAVTAKAQSLLESLLAAREPDAAALVVFDLDGTQDLEGLLTATNQVRDEFRKQFPLPVVLWVTDGVLQAMNRCAPDFKSWAATPIRFELAVTEAIDLWWQTTDQLFEDLLAAGCDRFLSNETLGLAPGQRRRRELELARADLQDDDARLLPLSEATWQFILGRDAFAAGQYEQAIAHYQVSLDFWSNTNGYWELRLVELANRTSRDAAARFTNPFLQQKALVLIHLGFAYSRQAREQADNRAAWLAAQTCWGASLEIFTLKERAENAAQALGLLCEALAALEAWETLDELACYALEQPAIGTARARLAGIYAAFARVSLARDDAAAAEYWVQLTLDVGPLAAVGAATYAGHLLLLAQAKQQLNEAESAIQALEQARSLLGTTQSSKPNLSPEERDSQRLYCQVLAHLRARYRDQQQYRLAFQLKQEQQWVEQRCGLRAFQGLYPLARADGGTAEQAELLAVSGRLPDVEQLSERLTLSDRKLLILHGASGTGKSTLLLAGLLPALRGQFLAAREVLTVFQSHYTDWELQLCRVFADALHQYRRHRQDLASPAIPPWLPDRVGAGSVLDRLRQTAGERYFTVLIFDQLEDFFSHHPQPEARRRFGNFLYEALRLPFVKVVLCLREDHLYELLALEAVTPNLLDDNWLARENRYPLGDLSREAAIAAIRYLTKQAQLPLEPELIEAVVQDLAGTTACVRPLELQLIGAQLQSDGIATWQQYQQLGPRPQAVLLQRTLEASVADCGQEHEAIAWQILLALTDASGNRPRRSQPFLQQLAGLRRASASTGAGRPRGAASDTVLVLVLEILCGSGLLLYVARDDCYQLSRDYLVEPIRQHVRQRTEQAYTRRLQASQIELARVRRDRWRAALLGGLMAALALAAGLFAVQAHRQRQLAQQAATDAQIAALSASSEALFQAGKHFDALVEALRGTTQLAAIAEPPVTRAEFPQTTQPAISSATQLRALASLEQALATVRERNRLQGHADIVWHADFSPDGRRLATASSDGQVKLWHADGRELATLAESAESITSVDFAPNDNLLLASGWDGRVRLWDLAGDRPRQRWKIAAHADSVFSAQFSPDGRQIVTASEDGSLKLWTAAGQLKQTLRGHAGGVRWASFSPDGRYLASAGKDNTVRLWSATGELLATLNGHADKVAQASFSPDGAWLASAADDGMVLIWQLVSRPDGLSARLHRRIEAHEGWAVSVQPSPDSQRWLSTGEDGAIALWNNNGEPLATLRGHSDIVTSARFSPNSLTIASTSYDKTARLWQLPPPETPVRPVLRGHHDRLTAIDFAPDNQTLATASADSTVRLWSRQGEALATLIGHAAAVEAVAFSPAGEELASAGRDRVVQIWDRQGRLQRTLTGATGELLTLAWHPSGRRLAAGGRDGNLWLWDADGRRRERLPLTERVNAIAFSPDGQYLAAASDDQQVWVWEAAADGRFDVTPPRQFQGHRSFVLDVAFVPPALQAQFATPPLLASAGYDNTIRFWSATGETLRELTGHTDSVAHLRFGPTGQVLATTTWSSAMQTWTIDDTLLKTWEGHRERATSLSWSPDGTAIATASEDGTALIWELNLADLQAASCQWLRDYLRHNPRVPKRDRHLCQHSTAPPPGVERGN